VFFRIVVSTDLSLNLSISRKRIRERKTSTLGFKPSSLHALLVNSVAIEEASCIASSIAWELSSLLLNNNCGELVKTTLSVISN